MLKPIESTKKRSALGLGLDALLPFEEAPQAPAKNDRDVLYVPINSLTPNPNQPRRVFPEESLTDLSNSIKEMGVIQPLIVRPSTNGGYELVAGERRWRAAGMAGFKEIPVLVRNISDHESLEIALIENLQREDLNPMDTAEAYDTLIKKFAYTHDFLAKRMGKDRTSITNYLRLLKLPDPIKQDLRNDRLSMGHARTLLAVDNLPTQLSLGKKVVTRKLSVRELEKIVNNFKKKVESKQVPAAGKSRDTLELEKGLSRSLSTKVAITIKSNNYGKIAIHFHSPEELERLVELLGYSEDFT